MKKIILAGGCFWGVEAYFQRVKGVVNTEVGYIDGYGENPSYEAVCDGSGHAEAVLIEYNEITIELNTILKHFFRIIDPTQINRQGNDKGIQYRSAIYYFDEETRSVSIDFIKSIEGNYKLPIQTKVVKASTFYRAEEYHQKYLDKTPNGYCHIDLSLLKEELE